MCDRILEYFNPERVRYKVTLDASGKPYLAEFPTFAGFAWQEGVHRGTLLNWRNTHPEFFDAYARAKEGFEALLVTAGLLGAIDPQFAAFTAKNTIGWRDKIETSTAEDHPLVQLLRAADEARTAALRHPKLPAPL